MPQWYRLNVSVMTGDDEEDGSEEHTAQQIRAALEKRFVMALVHDVQKEVAVVATCPQCGNSSRSNPDSMVVESVLVAKPETVRVEGVLQQPVVDATEKMRLSCKACGWSIFGRMEGESFVVYPGDNP